MDIIIIAFRLTYGSPLYRVQPKWRILGTACDQRFELMVVMCLCRLKGPKGMIIGDVVWI